MWNPKYPSNGISEFIDNLLSDMMNSFGIPKKPDAENDDDYVCHNCGDALSSELIGTGAMCHNCEYNAEHPHDEIGYDDFDDVHAIDDIEDEIDHMADLMDHGRI